jgi:hypothetical protein
MAIKQEKLKSMGWSKKEIENAMRLAKKSEYNKPRFHKNLEKSSFWVVLFLIILTNFLVGYALLPFLLILNKGSGFLILILIGVFFGILISHLIKDLEKQIHHHLIFLIIIPISAFVSFLFMDLLAKDIAQNLHLTIFNPLIIAILYSLAFISPYLAYFYKEIKHLVTPSK